MVVCVRLLPLIGSLPRRPVDLVMRAEVDQEVALLRLLEDNAVVVASRAGRETEAAVPGPVVLEVVSAEARAEGIFLK
jgi:hypothetical protein